jgi:putative glutamine amidotransferase
MPVSARRPAIGISTPVNRAQWGVWDQPAALLPYVYVNAVIKAGGLPLMVPVDPHLVEDPDDVLARLDGLILSGGSDIDPDSYGAVPHPATNGQVRSRDDFEIALARRAIELDIPVLGICRGMQLLNVCLGGTLLQHLPDVVGNDEHRRFPGSFDGSDHDVRLAHGSLAAQAAGEVAHTTKSHHHQGVDKIGDGLVVSGHSELDDLVEAIELPGRRFVLGVQWHPEADPASNVVAALVEAGVAYAADLDGSREVAAGQRTAAG